MDEVFWLALSAGLLLALPIGPLGAVVVWQRMAYMGDAIAHASLLGVALAMALQGIGVPLAIVLVAVLVALLLVRLTRNDHLQADTALGMLAHGGLALGVVLFALTGNSTLDLHAFLFGDILMVTWSDVARMGAGALLVMVLVFWQWRNVLCTLIHPDIAALHGVNTVRLQQGLVCVLAIMVALAIPMVGALLITALLIIPAATARLLAQSPGHMAVIGSLIAMLTVSTGLMAAFYLDTPASPTMVVIGLVLFGLCRLLQPSQPCV